MANWDGKTPDSARRNLIAGALSLPLGGLATRALGEGMAGLPARIEAIAGPIVGKLVFGRRGLTAGR